MYANKNNKNMKFKKFYLKTFKKKENLFPA